MSYQEIEQQLKKYPHTKLIVVAKNRNVDEIQSVIDQAAEHLAFNRIQEAQEKFSLLKTPPYSPSSEGDTPLNEGGLGGSCI